MSCPAQDGASYQESPIRMSGLLSRFTSATATPSERNLASITVFFHVGSPLATVVVRQIVTKAAQVRTRMLSIPRLADASRRGRKMLTKYSVAVGMPGWRGRERNDPCDLKEYLYIA